MQLAVVVNKTFVDMRSEAHRQFTRARYGKHFIDKKQAIVYHEATRCLLGEEFLSDPRKRR